MVDLPNSLGARHYGSYRLTRHGEVAVAMTNEDEATPITLIVTASGDTEILPAPGAGNYLTIKGFHFSNNHSSKVTVSLKAGTGGENKFSAILAANGGSFDKNLIGRYWRLPINKPLVVNLSGASDVYVTIEYEGLEEPGQEAVTPTDAITFAESLIINTGKKATDAQAITVALSKKAYGLGKSESEPLASAVANLTTLSLSDNETIVESEIESPTKPALTDSITFAEGITKISTGKGLSESVGINEGLIEVSG